MKNIDIIRKDNSMKYELKATHGTTKLFIRDSYNVDITGSEYRIIGYDAKYDYWFNISNYSLYRVPRII